MPALHTFWACGIDRSMEVYLHALTLLQLPSSRPQRGVEMTWDMKAQQWIERPVTFFCADHPFAEGAMRRAFYIKVLQPLTAKP